MNPPAPGAHVLVVDDNADAAEVLALLIETEGFEVSTAGTLAEARALIASHRPAIVLLDLHLPDGSGLALLAELKTDPATAGTRVIVLSGLLGDEVQAQARALGAEGFLAKPFGHETLSRALHAPGDAR